MGSVSPDAVSQYLKQTRELFGDELFLDQTPTSTKTEPKKMNPDLPSNIDGFYKQIPIHRRLQ